MNVFEGSKDEIIKLRVRQKELEMYTSLIISVWAIVFSVFTSVDALEELTKSFNYIFPILSVIMFLFCLYKICQVKKIERRICEFEYAMGDNNKSSDCVRNNLKIYEVTVRDVID